MIFTPDTPYQPYDQQVTEDLFRLNPAPATIDIKEYQDQPNSHSLQQMSAYNSSHPSVSNSGLADGPHPPKRKRLAKACEYCHKSKRRCDGFAPCNNCTFARRKCRYLDPSKREVAPPNGPARPLPEGWHPSADGVPRPPTPVPTSLDAHFLLLEPAVISELVSIFFASCHPLTSMIQRPSFLYDLSRGRAQSFLLLSMFSVAAPFAKQFHADSDTPWQAGNHFALQASREIFHEEFIGQHTVDPPDSLDSLRIAPSLELAQSLCMLHLQRNAMRREGKPSGFLVLALQVLQQLNIRTLESIPPSAASYASHIKTESLRRVFWTLFELSCFARVLTGEDGPRLHAESQAVQLPVEDSLFELPMAEINAGARPSYNYLAPPPDQTKLRSEFGNLLRITTVYTAVTAIVHQKEHNIPIGEIGNMGVQTVERDFQRWIDLLPDHLRLTDENLQVRITQMEHGSGAGGWCFAYMHALYECTMLALHECNDTLGPNGALRPKTFREQKAVDNIVRILSALGSRGRSNSLVAVLLIQAAKHCTAEHQSHIFAWFEEYERMWGVRLADYLDPKQRYKFWSIAGTPSKSQINKDKIDVTPHSVNGSSKEYRIYGSSGSSRNSGLSDGDMSLSMAIQDGSALPANREDAHHRQTQYDRSMSNLYQSQNSAALGLSNLSQSPQPNNGGLETLAAAVKERSPLPPHSPSRVEPHPTSLVNQSRTFMPHGIISESSVFTNYPLSSHSNSIAGPGMGSAYALKPVVRQNGFEDDDARSESPSPLNTFHRGGLGQRSYERGTSGSHHQANFNGHEGAPRGLTHAHAGSRHGHSLSLE